MHHDQIKFNIISHNSESYLKCLELRHSILGREVDKIEVELERYHIHIAAQKGQHIIAMAILKPLDKDCQIKHMYFSSFARNYPFVQDEMLKTCQKIGWFYGFDEMFLEKDGCKILLNLEQNLLGERTQKYHNYRERLAAIVLYLIQNKNSLLEYEIDYFLANYDQLFGSVRDEFARGAITAMQIKYDFENKHRLELQNTTYGDLLNILDEINLEGHTIDLVESLISQITQPEVIQTINYPKLVKLSCHTSHARHIIDLLNQKNINCLQHIEEIARKHAILTIAMKAHNLSLANRCIDLTTKSRDTINGHMLLLQSSIELFSQEKYDAATEIATEITTEFLAEENLRQSQSKETLKLGKWTKQIKK
jgi:hypothetical protein